MKTKTFLAAAGLCAAALFAAPRFPGEMPEVGKPAPEIGAKTWFNQLGAEPNLASLRGSAVIIEFWSTT
jgi:hypothetical protein